MNNNQFKATITTSASHDICDV